jgi:Mrp family chromosome partitioning ATPase|eukprot:TRINITY_DN5594_c0_g1_i3.p1 TRINITY_DN5594_c0_g1~~TRINITY_DN5594_c0_g1_i3.p1  ORF type:complete len:119 (-),score=20.29 TRINITY_DN5594_c0_g1_i3:137-493(-)
MSAAMDGVEKPENAPEKCPGTSSEQAGKADSCAGCPNKAICATAPKGPDPDMTVITDRMTRVRHKVVVLSGKGGVGKSTFASTLAYCLADGVKKGGSACVFLLPLESFVYVFFLPFSF